jgi:hypothetical protein
MRQYTEVFAKYWEWERVKRGFRINYQRNPGDDWMYQMHKVISDLVRRGWFRHLEMMNEKGFFEGACQEGGLDFLRKLQQEIELLEARLKEAGLAPKPPPLYQ